MKILLVEDDAIIANLITQHLTSRHYVVDVVSDGAAGWSYGSSFEYDLLLLDLQLPQLNGIHLCQQLRAEGDMTPILLLTIEDNSAMKIQALDAGADDYVVKPFDMGELEARIRALLRRGQGQASPMRIWGELSLNPTSCEVSYDNQPLKLTSKEYKLLELLITNGLQVVSIEDILARLWSSDEFPVESTVRSHVRRLRNKLQKAGAPADLISTLHGRGYYLKRPGEGEVLPTEAEQQAQALSQEDLRSSPFPKFSQPLGSTDIQAQYLQFLNETWPEAKAACLSQIQQCLEMDWSERAAIAHRMAGTLGMLGLARAMEMAKALEITCQVNQTTVPEQEASFQQQLQQLQQQIDNTDGIQTIPSFPEPEPPVVWILSEASPLQQALQTVATSHRLNSRLFDDWQSVLQELCKEGPPNQLIAELDLLRNLGEQPDKLKQFTSELHGIPLLILGKRDTLSDRLQALRLSGTFLLSSKVSAEQMVTAGLIAAHKQSSHSLIHPSPVRPENIKVMVMDDDPHLLQHLLQQLNGLGFKVTTLADPKHFWTVLQSVKPDALVLDFKIPDITGLELCKLVRCDPRWKRLPILFLSILNDAETCQQAFSAGADDYLFKPVMGTELAHRILSRLERIKTLAS